MTGSSAPSLARSVFLRAGVSRSRPADDIDIDRTARPVSFRARDYPKGHLIERHSHKRAQLLYASKGVMVVATGLGIWVVPPQRAVWIPSGVEHEVLTRQAINMRSLYFDPETVAGLPGECRVVTVSPLLRELILYTVSRPPNYAEDGPDGRLIAVLIDQIQALPRTPLHLPTTSHPKLKRIVEALSAEPADPRSLEDWAGEVGASGRTLTRAFVAETGMTFREWRQQARLLESLTRLAAGQPVTTVALDLGYGSQSAFIAMFKRAFGTTPGKYFAD